MRYKIWWIPQVPGAKFEVPVSSLTQAKLLLETLARYDLFQLRHRIKPDFSNAGGLVVPSDDGGWEDFYTDDGAGIDDLTMKQCQEIDAKAGRT